MEEFNIRAKTKEEEIRPKYQIRWIGKQKRKDLRG